MGIHDGHRERMRQRLKNVGLDGFEEHEVLEWMLFHTVPRGNVNPVAHALKSQFGDLAGVLDAEYDELMQVEGVGEATALFLSNYLSVYKRYKMCLEKNQNTNFEKLDEIVSYLQIQFLGCREEMLRALFMDSTFHLLKDELISEGSVNAVRVNMRKITETSLHTKASFVILAHNHPSDIVYPSDADVSATINVSEVLSRLEVRLLDHLIIGKTKYGSMASSTDYGYIFGLNTR